MLLLFLCMFLHCEILHCQYYGRPPIGPSYNYDGYMVEFIKDMAQLTHKKEKTAVHNVSKHADGIIRGLIKSKQLQWFPKSLVKFTKRKARLLRKLDVSKIQRKALRIYMDLLGRSFSLSVELNRIIADAGNFFDAEDGDDLSEVLWESYNYPDTYLSDYKLCNLIITTFLRPFQRLVGTPQLQQLMDSIDKYLTWEDEVFTTTEKPHKLSKVTPSTPYYSTEDSREETYMIDFLIQLTQFLATAEKKVARKFLMHVYDIIHDFFDEKRLRWFAFSLVDFTKKTLKLIKKSKVVEIQKQAANLHSILTRRSDMLSDEVKWIIEYADLLYNEEDGTELMSRLNLLVNLDNWIYYHVFCRSLILHFLRPFQRRQNMRQRQKLMVSIDKALKSRIPPNFSNETSSSSDSYEYEQDSHKFGRHRIKSSKRQHL